MEPRQLPPPYPATGRFRTWREIAGKALVGDWSLSQKLLAGGEVLTRYATMFFEKMNRRLAEKNFVKKYLRQNDEGKTYFDLNGAKLPDVRGDEQMFGNLCSAIFLDTFSVSALYEDNYDAAQMDRIEPYLPEGAYGYRAGDFDVTVKSGEAVIDAGAWIGDFAAYAAAKGATVYAFEPTPKTFAWLQQTAALNDGIVPVAKGLGEAEKKALLYFYGNNETGSGNTVDEKRLPFDKETRVENIAITTLDQFAADNRLEKIDFIKADIEGAEREMLRGATAVLRKFAPKLAICTYHLPDDPQVLAQIIRAANPRYRIVQRRKKLFAAAG
ncbi:MAG: FkbM family methyltransferase [Planctomycetota bacterium]|jgi:FkbM family methyltransferase|nr:FkbM family methyltransferase [Planctomycetota bacterium]